MNPAYLEPLAEDLQSVCWVFTVRIILSVPAKLASAARFARPARPPRAAPPARPASAARPTMPTIHIYEDAEWVLRIPDIAFTILLSIEFVFVCTSIAGRRLAALSFHAGKFLAALRRRISDALADTYADPVVVTASVRFLWITGKPSEQPNTKLISMISPYARV